MAPFYFILFFAHILQAITGFGSTSIGVPFLSLALGTELSVLLLAPASLVLSAIVIGGNYKKICWRDLGIILLAILPIMPAGFLLYSRLRFMEWALRLIMGAAVTFIAGREIYRRLVKKDLTLPSVRATWLALFVGAIMEGMFSMGASMINFYAVNRVRDKGAFRATMASVWVMTNLVSTLYRSLALKAYQSSTWMSLLYALPLILAAYYLGNRFHKKISEEKFKILVYAIQLTAGLLSIGSGLVLLIRTLSF